MLFIDTSILMGCIEKLDAISRKRKFVVESLSTLKWIAEIDNI